MYYKFKSVIKITNKICKKFTWRIMISIFNLPSIVKLRTFLKVIIFAKMIIKKN